MTLQEIESMRSGDTFAWYPKNPWNGELVWYGTVVKIDNRILTPYFRIKWRKEGDLMCSMEYCAAYETLAGCRLVVS